MFDETVGISGKTVGKIWHTDITKHFANWLAENCGAMQPVECYAAEHMYFVRPAEPQSIRPPTRAHVRTILAMDKLRRLRGRD